MAYNKQQFSNYLETAGKITIFTAFAGVVFFSLIFLLNLGAKEYKQATAQEVATTSVTVLNTPPYFIDGPYELVESSTSTPTNSGGVVTFAATAEDGSTQDWFLLVCDGNATPTATLNRPPECNGSDLLWAVSGTTTSGSQATAATTTTESFPPFQETNEWYAWACDAVDNARCSVLSSQGTTSTSTPYRSPFNVNRRPAFTGYWNDSPADPGVLVTFYATATDQDSVGGQDTLRLFVCSTNSFNSTSSLGCNETELGSTTVPLHPNATATYQLPTVIQDDDYNAFGFIADSHGHEATGGFQGIGTDALTVNNVAPTMVEGDINLNNGALISLTEGIENTGFTLDFTVSDANSCDSAAIVGTADEIATTTISIYRSGIGNQTCSATSSAAYDPNNCYPSAAPPATWNLQCTASTTSCTFQDDGIDDDMVFNCTFPLWFVADPTEGPDASTTPYFDQEWRASVAGVDDDGASSTFTEGVSNPVEIDLTTALNLLDTTIPYGSLEPGGDTGSTNASTTAESTGNTGLNHNITGESMCEGYVPGIDCFSSNTSTIDALYQQFSSSTFTYGGAGDWRALSSTSQGLADIRIPKTSSTTDFSAGDTFWGIAVPSSITFAGSYTGENTITAVVSDPTWW